VSNNYRSGRQDCGDASSDRCAGPSIYHKCEATDQSTQSKPRRNRFDRSHPHRCLRHGCCFNQARASAILTLQHWYVGGHACERVATYAAMSYVEERKPPPMLCSTCATVTVYIDCRAHNLRLLSNQTKQTHMITATGERMVVMTTIANSLDAYSNIRASSGGETAHATTVPHNMIANSHDAYSHIYVSNGWETDHAVDWQQTMLANPHNSIHTQPSIVVRPIIHAVGGPQRARCGLQAATRW
jgi:hypothetical protein